MNGKINTILFLGKHNDFYSNKIFNLFKKSCKKIIKANSKIKIKKILDSNLKFDFIILYRTRYILKEKDLKKGLYGSINFHPATPEYRGIGGVNYAIFYKKKIFGSTCHLINTEIDSGKIINVKKFYLNEKDDLEKTLKKIYKLQYSQAEWLIRKISKNKKFALNFKSKIKWSKILYTKKMLNEFYHLKLSDIGTNTHDIKRYLRSTVYKRYIPSILKKNYFK